MVKYSSSGYQSLYTGKSFDRSITVYGMMHPFLERAAPPKVSVSTINVVVSKKIGMID